MRRAGLLLLLLAGLALAAGCGGDEPADDAARHLDPRSDAVAVVDLRYDGANWAQLKRLYERAVASGGADAPATLDAGLSSVATSLGLSFEEDVRPLLGGTLQLGLRVEAAERVVLTATYRAGDAEALDRVLGGLRREGVERKPIAGVEDAEWLGEGVALLGGDTIIAVIDEGGDPEATLRAAIERAEGPELPDLGDDLLAARAGPGLLRAWLAPAEADRVLATAAGAALRGAELRVRLHEDAARARAHVDFEGLADAQLPLPAAAPLELPAGESVASGSADQRRTTVFLAGLARALWPESRFVRRVEAFERSAGVRFEDAVLEQFAGPSVSVLRPGGEGSAAFAARSTVADPERMRALLDELAPALPGILEGLQGLGSGGLTALLLVAPDAPLTPAAAGLLAQVAVARLPGAPDEQLYTVAGLDPGNRLAGPDRVVYGLIGDVFVVASTEALAREAATLPTEPAGEAATRVRFDLAALIERSGFWRDAETIALARALLAGAEASASARDGDVVADALVRWAG